MRRDLAGIIPRQHLLSEAVARAIRVSSNRAKLLLDAQARSLAKVIHQVEQAGIVGVRRVGFYEPFGAQASGGDGEQLRADVHEPAKQELLAFELWAVTQHGVEQRASKPAARFPREAKVLPQQYAFAPANPQPATRNPQPFCEGQPLPWIPARVENAGFGRGTQAPGQRKFRVEDRGAHLEMWVEGFARDEKSHDFTRSLKNSIDPAVAQETLQRHWVPSASLK